VVDASSVRVQFHATITSLRFRDLGTGMNWSMPRGAHALLCAGLLSALCVAQPQLTGADAAFQEWFDVNYARGSPLADREPPVRLAPVPGGLRMGVVATRAIAPESRYLAIPLPMIVGEHTVFSTPGIGPALKALQPVFDRHPFGRLQFTLAVFLLHQRFVAGAASFWRPYIDALPDALDAPEFFSDAELGLMNGTGVPQKARALRASRDDEFRFLARNVLANPAVAGAKQLFPSWAFSRKHWGWAGGILNTRMIWWDGRPHLVPLLDMINCKEGPGRAARRIHQTVRDGNRALTKAPWAFAAGEQVFENYGQPNPSYMLYHGYAMHPNVHDCATAPLDLGKQLLTRGPTLRQLGLWRDDFCVAPDSVGLGDMLAAARVAVATKPELDKFKASRNAAKQRLGPRNERAALKMVGKALAALRDSLPSLPELAFSGAARPQGADERTAERFAASQALQDLPFRERMATLFREGQRVLLQRTVAALRQRSAAEKQHDRRKREPRVRGNKKPPSNDEL
jgi:hypothetical protein